MDTRYAAPGFTIYHDPSMQCLLVEWRGAHNGLEKQACCQIVLQQLAQTTSIRMLVDSTQDLDTWAEAVHWLGHEYAQALVVNGMQAVAWVLPHYVRAQVDIDHVLHYVRAYLRSIPQGFVISTFHDVEAAHTWLKTQGTTEAH